jgi:hypothetical protein
MCREELTSGPDQPLLGRHQSPPFNGPGTLAAGTGPTKETHRFDVEKPTVEVANRAKGQR